MRNRIIAMAAAAGLFALLVALTAVLGDGGGDVQARIRTDRGLPVAAQVPGLESGAEADDGADEPASGDAAGRGGVIAPDFYPYPMPELQGSQQGITVQGFGSATAEADGALLELYFGPQFPDGIEPVPEPAPLPGETEPGFDGSGAAPAEPDVDTLIAPVVEITEADLQPVVDAMTAQGVSAADIEVTIDPYGGYASIRVTVRNIAALDGIMAAAEQAAAGLEEIGLQGTGVTPTISDCSALELAAMQEAVADARERGETFAGALGVVLGDVVGASHYTYSPYGSPCDSGLDGPVPLGGDVAYAEGLPTEVSVISSVAVTFAIR